MEDYSEFKVRVSDYFDAFDLVDLLGIKTEEIVEAFGELIEEHADMLEDYMLHGR